MAEKYIMIHDIIEDHNARMQNLRKYYPFFCLNENTFTQYREGKYIGLDMGYITMASLRFFINENSFHEQEISYEQYEGFLSELLHRDFSLEAAPAEEKELISYIFDKIKNEGKPFEFRFFDPDEKKTKVARVKLIDSRIADGMVLYHITAEGIEFYLDTKEMKEESKISIQQLLLEKMIQSNNFKGGIQVVRRINNEVSKLIYKKREVLNILSYDVFAGAKASEEYMATVARWFADEQKLFKKNKELIEQALNKAAYEGKDEEEKSNLYRSLQDINELDMELKRTITRHNELISETIALQKAADKMIERAKLRRLRTVFDFKETMRKLEKQDTPEALSHVLMPLFAPSIQKTFSMHSVDNLLTYRAEQVDKGEKVKKEKVDTGFQYEDELEDARIAKNFGRMFYELLDQLTKRDALNVKELNGILEIKFGKEIYRNGDYYAFLVHLSQKREYHMEKLLQKQDTFLEGIIADMLAEEEKQRFQRMAFTLQYAYQEKIELGEGFEITNILFERIVK